MRSWTTSGRGASPSRRCTHRRAGSTVASATAWRRSWARSISKGIGPRSSADTAPAAGCGSFRRSEALPLMRPVYDEVQSRRPGMIALDDRWWRALFFERETEKDDPTFFAVHDTDGVVDAYAAYRVKHDWTDSLPDLELTVKQLIATTPDAYADIWRFVFDVDLVRRVKAWNRPVDEPLIYLMEEPNRLRFRTSNALWVRLVDVPAALEARGYVGDGRIVVDVEDRVLPLERGPVRTRRQWGSGLVPSERARRLTSLAARQIWAPRTWEAATFRQLHRAGRVDELRAGGPRCAQTRCSRRMKRPGAPSASSPTSTLSRRGSPAPRTPRRSPPGRSRARRGSIGALDRPPTFDRRSPAA